MESKSMLPFLGIQLLNKHTHVETKVYVTTHKYWPPATLQKLRRRPVQTWIIKNDAWSCISTFMQWALLLWRMWSTELLFSRLKYPDKLVNSSISRFVAAKACDQPVSSPTFSDQPKWCGLIQKIHTTVQPVFVTIEQDLKLREAKPPIVNQQCLVYKFECDLYMRCRLFWFQTPPSTSTRWKTQKLFFINWQTFSRQTFFGWKRSYKKFSVLIKCTNKFDCFVYEMFLFKSEDLLLMCNRTQFVLRFLRASVWETGADLEKKVGRFRLKLVHKVLMSTYVICQSFSFNDFF